MSVTWKTNRQKKRMPKGGIFWCWGCDMQLVEQWKKCKYCGHRNGRRTNKK